MPTLTISDEILREAGLDERSLVVELASRLFDAGRLSLFTAGKLAGLDRQQMEDALLDRGIPIYRPQLTDLAQDLDTLKRLGA
jgi:predicted HTH domain antitoxin